MMPFLKSPNPKIVRTALKALSKTIGMDGTDIYVEYLANSHPGISKTAFTIMHSHAIRGYAELLHEYCVQSAYAHVKKYAILLLLQEDTWERLPFLLHLYGNETFIPYEELMLEAIKNRTTYGKLSRQKSARIYDNLKVKEQLLPPQLRKEILFDLRFLTR